MTATSGRQDVDLMSVTTNPVLPSLSVCPTFLTVHAEVILHYLLPGYLESLMHRWVNGISFSRYLTENVAGKCIAHLMPVACGFFFTGANILLNSYGKVGMK